MFRQIRERRGFRQPLCAPSVPHEAYPTLASASGVHARSGLSRALLCGDCSMAHIRLKKIAPSEATAVCGRRTGRGDSTRPPQVERHRFRRRLWTKTWTGPPLRQIYPEISKGNGGEGGIRTLDTLASMPHFECGAFNRSATSPEASPPGLGPGRASEGAIPTHPAPLAQGLLTPCLWEISWPGPGSRAWRPSSRVRRGQRGRCPAAGPCG